MMHFGHANALRQAKQLFGGHTKLIAGVHDDKDITKHKGPPVMKEEERYAAVRACKWVDEVAEAVPYVTELDVLEKYGVDYVVHGDDLTFDENGEDCYRHIKAAGKMLIVRRTEGVSTTDLVNRMLRIAAERKKTGMDSPNKTPAPEQLDQLLKRSEEDLARDTQSALSPYTKVRQYLPTVSKIQQFASPNIRSPDHEKDIIVYVDGGFDLFHVGHMAFLEEARKLGTYLIVGLHEDSAIRHFKGEHHPIMNVNERVLGVLSCRWVDDVVMGAPFIITQELIDSFGIHYVVTGSVRDSHDIDTYELPKKLGIFKEIPSPKSDLTTSKIIQRIILNMQKYEERNKKKQQKELNSLDQQEQ